MDERLQFYLTEWGPRILGAILILVAAHFIAAGVKWTVSRMLSQMPGLRPPGESVAGRMRPRGAGAARSVRVSDQLGDVAYWLVWLLGLIAALNVLQLETVVAPLNAMMTQLVAFIPNVVGAALILAIGLVVANVVRRLVETAVSAANVERWTNRAGLSRASGPGLGKLLGMLVFIVIAIPVAIAALNALQIEAVSAPAVGVLTTFVNAIPGILAAAIVLFIAYVVGRFAGTLAQEALASMGFDGLMRSMGQAPSIRDGLRRSAVGEMRLGDGHGAYAPTSTSAAPPGGIVAPETQYVVGGAPDADASAPLTPSRVVGNIVTTAIILFSAVEAARFLGFVAIAAMLTDIIVIAGRVLFGAVIIAIAVVVSNILAQAASRSAQPGAPILSAFVRWGGILLGAAIGLRFMGLANEIIILAFGLTLGAVALAGALAFGIGGRDAAGRLFSRYVDQAGGGFARPQPPTERPPTRMS